MEATEVVIPIFLHPHLFWLFETKDTVTRQQIEHDLRVEYEGTIQPEKHFCIGEIVIIYSNNKWTRAIIEDILDGPFKYEVWLMDYGYLNHINVVYESQKRFKLLPPLVKQASLYNCVFIDEALSLENSCIIRYKNLNPTAGSTISALQFLKGYDLYFLKQKSLGGVVFGDILYKKKGFTSSLTKTLTDELLMVEDENLFSKIEQNRVSDKDFHMQALRRASKSHPGDMAPDLSLLMGQVLTRSTRGLSLSKSCSESECTEKSTKSLSRRDILNKLKRTSVKKTNSCTESESDELKIEKESVLKNNCNFLPDSLSESEQGTKKSEKLQNLKKSNAGTSSHNETSSLKRRELLSKLRSRNRGSINSTKTDIESISDLESQLNSDNPRESNMLKAPNTLFLPAGFQTKRMGSKKKKLAKPNDPSIQYYSDSVLSNDRGRLKVSQRPKTNAKKGVARNLTSIDENGGTDTSVTMNSESDWYKSSDNKENQSDQNSQMEVKPTCSCPQCEHWSTSDDWRTTAENFSSECKAKTLDIIKSQSLMLRGKREVKLKLNSINYKSMTKIEKQATPKLLVHGHILPIPIVKVAEASFHETIHHSLKHFGYSRAKKSQSYVWPAITRFMNVCCIHRKKSGKTMAYLVPLLSFLLEKNERYKDFKKGGPIITVLCSNSSECEKVFDLSQRLLKFEPKKPRVISVTYPLQYINLSSVDMIITIPPVFIELLKNNAINLKRLCHLVLDNCNMLFEKYFDEIIKVAAAVESMSSHRLTGQSVQIIMTGERWTRKIKNFIKHFREIPLISIGNYLEAALYGNMNLCLKCIRSESKKDTIVGILEKRWKFLKSIIVCTAEAEIENVSSCLELSSISFIAIPKSLTKEQIIQQESNWEYQSGGDYKVLICTDQTLHTMLSITSATLLIHYSLPESWTSLVKRYNCLLENLRSPLLDDDNKVVCESYILIDESCSAQIPKLYSFLKNFDSTPDELQQIAKQIEMDKERAKIDSEIPLCSLLKQFGYCHIEDCQERHVLHIEQDSISSLPKNRSIKFKILKIIDVNSFEIDIVEYRDIDGMVIPFKTAMSTEELTSVLTENKQKAEVVTGKSYAYWDTDDFDDLFRECIVKGIEEDGIDILVKETCKRIKVSKNKLFNLPEELQITPDRGNVELILANLKPPYKDEKFSARAFYKLAVILADQIENTHFVADVCLELRDTIWVNDITVEVDVFDLKLCKFNLMQEILNGKLAVPNEEHMKRLYALCADAGITVPELTIPVVKKKSTEIKQVSPQWAFLEMDNYNKVFFTSAISPNEIYVRHEKFHMLLRHLDKDIAEEIKKQGSKLKQNFTVSTGKYYLAEDKDGKFCRVCIKRIEDNKALCYSVDYGDESVVALNDLKYLPDHLITKLPFQAIQCSLYGVQPIGDEWTDSATDILYKYTFENKTTFFRTLYAKCLSFEKGDFEGQLKFSILLKDGFDKMTMINNSLIECGCAEIVPDEMLYDFEILSEKQESEEGKDSDGDENNLEQVNEILKKTEMVDSNRVKTPFDCEKQMGELEACFGEPEEEAELFMNFMNLMIQNSIERERNVQPKSYTLPAITAAPTEVNYCTPDVYWSQTQQTVQLVIKLPNINEYRVKIQNARIFIFDTVVNEKKYALKILLYDAVERKFDEKPGGLELKIVLKKVEEQEWPKLSKNKGRLRNVHYMLSQEEMKDEEKKRILDFGDELKDSTLWGDEEAPMFTVMSDMDSDYDMDLEEDSDY